MKKGFKKLQILSAEILEKFGCIFITLCVLYLAVLLFLLWFATIGFVFHYFVLNNDISIAINNTIFALIIIIGMLLLFTPFALFYWKLGIFFKKKEEK